MTTIEEREAWYPAFQLGHEPQAIKCTLRIVEANGRKYLHTPFAMLDVYGDDHSGEIDRAIGRGFYTTEAECQAYLDAEYPHWKLAAPIMDALESATRYDGAIVGPGKLADRLGVSMLSNHLYQLVRGHRRFGRKQIRDYAALVA